MEGIPNAKAIFWCTPDTEVRKRGERTGLDTLVVRALNDADSFLEDKKNVGVANKEHPHTNPLAPSQTHLLREKRVALVRSPMR